MDLLCLIIINIELFIWRPHDEINNCQQKWSSATSTRIAFYHAA